MDERREALGHLLRGTEPFREERPQGLERRSPHEAIEVVAPRGGARFVLVLGRYVVVHGERGDPARPPPQPRPCPGVSF